MMRLQDYYTVHRDDSPLLPVERDVVTGDGALTGYVECFHGLASLLDSGVLLMACVGFIDDPKQQIIAFEADPTETRNPEDRQGLVARPVSVRVATPLREFLQRVAAGGDPDQRTKAEALLERIDVSLDFPEDARPDPESEFSRGPYDEDPLMIDVCVVALADTDMMARAEGPWVEGRSLPRGYIAGFFSPQHMLMSAALQGAVAQHDAEHPMYLFQVNVEDDMICFPEGYDTSEPKRIYFRPIEVLESVAVPEWLEAQQPSGAEEIERHGYLTRSLANSARREAE